MWKMVLLAGFCANICNVAAQTLRDVMHVKPIQFQSPMDGTLHISGTFGEPRPNHYHAGLDIKTGGKTGLPVRAAEDGFISRIRVSPGGYGHALYVDHPNGLTTVYAHLERFEPGIAAYVRELQYKLESFEIDTLLPDKRFKFEKGQIIAYSGNTGGSAGPHLHFEIRETMSELVVNPMAFGFKVQDKTPPLPLSLKVYPVRESIYDHPGIALKLTKSGDVWSAGHVEVPAGRVAFSVQAFDRQDHTPEHKNGIPVIRMLENDQLLFLRKTDTIDFSQTRYAHAMIDYAELLRKGSDFYLACRLPGNLEHRPYRDSPTDGFITIREGETRKITIELEDFHGNTSKITVSVKGIAPGNTVQDYTARPGIPGTLQATGAGFSWDGQAFYDAVRLEVTAAKEFQASTYSPVYRFLSDKWVAIHTPVKVSMSEHTVPGKYLGKTVIVLENYRKTKKALATTAEGNVLKAAFNEPGNLYVMIDTVAPEVRLLNFDSKMQTFSGKQIRVKITDNLSGIRSYKGYIDEQWILLDYDAKNALLIYQMDEKCPPGEHHLHLVVSDSKDNTTTLNIRFKN